MRYSKLISMPNSIPFNYSFADIGRTLTLAREIRVQHDKADLHVPDGTVLQIVEHPDGVDFVFEVIKDAREATQSLLGTRFRVSRLQAMARIWELV